MAFVPVNLAVLSYAAGFTLWTYSSAEDTVGTVLAPGYFDPAKARLRRDDVVLIAARDGGAIAFVSAASPAGVSLEPLAQGGATSPPAIPAGAILAESGIAILAEDGAFILAD
ncbi:MAG: hypothetical protein NZ523_07050 [Elioraea sp.]|nr:hypothetical protein [Elioraea sp.]MDW8443545.1 hypothetical protein [Acetobacteraceae bacterium]